MRTPSIPEQISMAIRHFFQGFNLIRKHGLTWVYLTPILIYLVLFALGISLTNGIHESVTETINNWMQGYSDEDDWLAQLIQIGSFLSWIIIKVFLFLVFAIFSGYITLIFLSPLLTYISEKIDEKESGNTYPFDLMKFFKDIWRAVLVALRNGFTQLVLVIGLMILSFIPLINLVTTPLLFMLSAYFYGFSLLDYNYERLGLSMRQGVRETRRLKWLSMSFGSIFLLANMIPWIGMFISTLLLFPLVAGSSTAILKLKDQN